jgi:molybdopterin-guanine dinucleotide biosynthesis protein A
MPFVNIPLLAYQVDVLLEQGADVVIPRVEHGLEPLHCVYRRETCLPVVEQTFRSGKMALVSWLNKVHTEELSKEQIEHYDPQFRAFINVNTPQEFSQAEGLADESA